ncbi:ketol-acid reductoisomerase [Antricoccus suffuscus]|uniref:Ketol-acid reductoisomerase type 1 n=1 Tax=Antricoccus suffuscus TaxID=1629062 RepID=A0A2T1A1J8_9ACTN|nr:NAD(P)-binding domain-containing protein [Antricoccus suffuscus]PRZ42208.1 ketol-acid reductoisomerase [Antricoccus suffuscus]
MDAEVFDEFPSPADELAGRTIAVIGYGNQGHAQAQNLRDSGCEVLVGNRDDEFRAAAQDAGFEVVTIEDAARRAQIMLLLIPDEVQPEVFRDQIAPGLQDGDTIVVASGYNVHFGLLDIADTVDIVMVAPRMIGEGVRDHYERRESVPCLVSVEHDASGRARGTALAVASGIGVLRGAVSSSVREEVALDLFSEQAIWPSIMAIFQAGYDVLANAGFSDDAILDELYLSGEPAEILGRVSRVGMIGQLGLHSKTSQYGQLTNLLRSGAFTDQMRERFAGVLNDQILSGAFSQDWSGSDTEPDADARIAALRKKAEATSLSVAERAVLDRWS